MQESGLNAHQLNSPKLSMISEQCQHLMNMLKQCSPMSSPHSSTHSAQSAIGTPGYQTTLNPKYYVFSALFVNLVPSSIQQKHSWIIDTG